MTNRTILLLELEDSSMTNRTTLLLELEDSSITNRTTLQIYIYGHHIHPYFVNDHLQSLLGNLSNKASGWIGIRFHQYQQI